MNPTYVRAATGITNSFMGSLSVCGRIICFTWNISVRRMSIVSIAYILINTTSEMLSGDSPQTAMTITGRNPLTELQIVDPLPLSPSFFFPIATILLLSDLLSSPHISCFEPVLPLLSIAISRSCVRYMISHNEIPWKIRFIPSPVHFVKVPGNIEHTV